MVEIKKIVFSVISLLTTIAFADFNQATALLGKYPKQWGPNCWNYALYSAGLVTTVRDSSSEEFQFFLNSKLCKKVSADSKVNQGQIGAIRDDVNNKIEEVHGFYFLNSNTVYTKNGSTIDSKFNKSSLHDVLANQEYTLSGHPNRKIDRFECQSLKSFLKSYIPNSNLQNIYTAVRNFEDHYELVTLENKKINLVFKDKVLSYIQNQINVLAKQNLSGNDLFLKSVIYYQISGLADQLYESHGDPMMSQFNRLADQLK